MKTQEEIDQEASDLISKMAALEAEPGLVPVTDQETLDALAAQEIERMQAEHDAEVIEIATPVPLTITPEDEEKFRQSDALLAQEMSANQAVIDAEAAAAIERMNG